MNYYIVLALIYIFSGSLFLVLWRLEYVYKYITHDRFGEGDSGESSRPDTSLTFVNHEVISFALIGTGFLFEGASLVSNTMPNPIASVLVASIEIILVYLVGRGSYFIIPDYRVSTPPQSIGASFFLFLMLFLVLIFTDTPSPLFSLAELGIFSFPFLVFLIYLAFIVLLHGSLKRYYRQTHSR